ncbi:MAG: cysteine synthase family protein [Chloroflexi bacterium]|nr:cysteine synthase family protein [Chloroflexota bacterium]MCY3582484.1 cysteine synthase family protein [Chloroflexota bacterium]MCY3716763.1 cysteine synthase family protein [Chloroflexota bacterium]MDE2651887.1 cysteine synthase family protein [Chloroflexota bacterium]MXV92191.1 cysteine synthase family protein [Chloroflexota bacterium]
MIPTAENQLHSPQTSSLALDIERQVGNTALLSFRRVTRHLPDEVRVFAKAEWQNPGGSVKDRAALSIIQRAEAAGQLFPGRAILDSTSGNTGIAYAMIGAAKDYRVKLFLPENVSPERVSILRAYDVQLVYTDPLEGSDGAIRAVRELAARASDSYFYADQYNNPANWQAHYTGTGAEIWRQTAGQVSHFVAGLGTSGTLVGAGRRLKQFNPAMQVVSVEPDSPFHGLEGLKHMGTALQPGIYDPRLVDEKLAVRTEAAHSMALRLAREEGYLVGISSAAAMVGALTVAEGLAERGAAGTVVTLFPDNAYKYLSEAFWRR